MPSDTSAPALQRDRTAHARRLTPAVLLGVLLVLATAGHPAAQNRPPPPPPPPLPMFLPGGGPAPGPRGTSAISGVVVDASGRPLAGATVVASGRTGGTTRFMVSEVTTPKGRFVFDELPASDDCTLVVSKPGYLDGGYGRTDPRGPALPIRLAPGEWIGDVRLTMLRPGSIGGRVLDERGEPVVGVYVRVLPQMRIAGRLDWLAGPVTQTDDRGEYRIAGLGPATYLVSVPSLQATLPASVDVKLPSASAGSSRVDLQMAIATARAERLLVDRGAGDQLVVGRHAVPPPPMPDGQPAAYPITFYANATRPDDATAVELRPGEERTGIDIALRPVPTARVSGIVQGPPDAVSNLLLRLMPAGLEELSQGSEAAATLTRADGRFTFVDVPYGSYVLDARNARLEFTYAAMDEVPTAVPAPLALAATSAAASGVRAAPYGVSLVSLTGDAAHNYWTRTPLDVSQDVSDLGVLLRPAASLKGRVIMPADPPAASPPSPRPLAGVSASTPFGSSASRAAQAGPRVSLTLEPAGGQRSLGTPGWRSDPASADPFAIDIAGVLGGPYVLHAFGSLTRIASVTWHGEDYVDRPFDFSSGADIEGVEVTIAASTSVVSGTVAASDGPLSNAAAVIAFPTNRERWSNYGLNPVRIASALTTSDGQFRLEGLPPGDYFVVAVPAAEERAWIDPRYLERRAGLATRVRVDDASTPVHGIALTLQP